MKQGWIHKRRKTLLIGVPLIVVLFIFVFYLFGGRYESTDNSYVQASKAGISANVAGQVVKIFVMNNQPVNQGDPLFEIDERPYKIAVENAKAQLLSAKLQVYMLRASYLQALAKMVEAQENLKYVQAEYKRQKELASSGISSSMDLDKAKNQYQMSRQEFIMAKQGWIAALAHLNNNPNIEVEDHPLVKQAQAGLDQANLNFEYTTVVAPFNGVVTKVDQLQLGDFVRTGFPVFALISNEDIWVEANFKETQITHMRPGQDVTIEIDAYSDHDFKGRVQSISPGTGSVFSLLPAENATGNWVKIVQRVPVRISIVSDHDEVALASGLSATVTVDTERSRFSSETKSNDSRKNTRTRT